MDCCRASLRVGAAGGTHGGAAGQPQGLFFTAASPPSLSPCCARALRTSPSPPTRPPGCVRRSRCVHVSLSRSPRCAHVRARTAPGSARVWSARGCPGALGAWCTALEASAPQSLRPKPPHQASASRPPGLTSRPPASSPGLQARCAPRVVATLSALHRDPILLAGQAPPLRVELKVDRLGRLVRRAALRAALLGRRLRCRHFHADDLLLADV